ncbi:unnamed protein product [Heligmosomoides polygyrus]|uniref:Charged multivesicular body protein 6 n=1 Tax=Heligmosomoides polygyrus TaxID=6339 RepID=A0A183GGL0_HELPZ|nr:unnamed protein product [Heligmosomoides polygyrus]
MGGLFSKKAAAPPKNCEITEQDNAILQLKVQRDKIKQFIRRKEKCMERERELARQLIKDGRKEYAQFHFLQLWSKSVMLSFSRALLLLKKKRYQENVIERTLKQLDNIDRMVHDLEFADIQQRVVEGLRQGNDALKKMNAIFDIDEIEKIMGETKEAAEYQDVMPILIFWLVANTTEEISALLSGQLSSADVEEAEQELEQLLASQTSGVVLPDVPTHELPQTDNGKFRKSSHRFQAIESLCFRTTSTRSSK